MQSKSTCGSVVILLFLFALYGTAEGVEYKYDGSGKWRPGFGLGYAFFAMVDTDLNKDWPKEAIYSFVSPAGMAFHLELTHSLMSNQRLSAGYGLGYALLNTRETDTSNSLSIWTPEGQRSRSSVSGSIITPALLFRARKRVHELEINLGVTLAFLESEIANQLDQPPTVTRNRSTSFGLTMGGGYNLNLGSHFIWRVILLESRLYFNNNLGLPDFGSIFLIQRIGSELVIAL